MFILTGVREYDENKNDNYVSLFIYHFSDDNVNDNNKMLTIEQWHVDCILVEFDSRYNDTNFHQKWRLSHLCSLLRQKSYTGILGPRISRTCVLENSKCYFANTQTESHAHITRKPTLHRTTTLDIKIMYTKTITNKIHKMQGVKFLENKHRSVWDGTIFIVHHYYS